MKHKSFIFIMFIAIVLFFYPATAYNSTTWSSMTSGTTAALYDVWGSSGSDVFAVGAGGIIVLHS